MMAYDHEKTPLSECLKIEAALTSDVHSKARLDAWVEHAKLLERDARRYYFLRDADDVPVSFGKQFDEDCDSAMRGSAYDASRPSKATHPQPVTTAGGEVVAYLHIDGETMILSRELASQSHQENWMPMIHPPGSDAALAALTQGWRDEAKQLREEYGHIDVSSTRADDLCECADMVDAALNQRGGG